MFSSSFTCAAQAVIPALKGELSRQTRTEFSLDLAVVDLMAGLSSGHRGSVRRGEKTDAPQNFRPQLLRRPSAGV